jgi:hypothetical protein
MAALSEMTNAAVRLPSVVGVNVIWKVQFAVGATVAPQPFVILKSPLFVPVMLAPVMVRAVLPPLEIVTVWGGLAAPTNVMLKVERRASATEAMPAMLRMRLF